MIKKIKKARQKWGWSERSLCGFLGLLRYGKLTVGCDKWDGKPKFGIFMVYYDGWIFCIHLFSLWLQIM